MIKIKCEGDNIKKVIVNTKYGDFITYQSIKNKKYPTILFLSAMGINSSFFDYYYIYKYLEKENVNIISTDILGCGISFCPYKKERTLENISNELKSFIYTIDFSDFYLMAHSFTSMYVMNIYNQTSVSGLIFIDPTIPESIIYNKNSIKQSINEAYNNKKNYDGMDADVNPKLPNNLKRIAEKFYKNYSGNECEISELKESLNTSEKMLNKRISGIKTLSFLSTMNYQIYRKMGNPYFNDNKSSVTMVLNGHHFLQWIYPKFISQQIYYFIK